LIIHNIQIRSEQRRQRLFSTRHLDEADGRKFEGRRQGLDDGLVNVLLRKLGRIFERHFAPTQPGTSARRSCLADGPPDDEVGREDVTAATSPTSPSTAGGIFSTDAASKNLSLVEFYAFI
jgi:hypothetical protein